MFEAIQYVGSGLTLVAFLVAACVYAYRRRLVQQEEIVKSAPENDRVAMAERVLTHFHIDTSGLTKQQRFDLAMEQLNIRKRWSTVAIILIVMLAIVTIVAVIANVWATLPTRKTVYLQLQPPPGQVVHGGFTVRFNRPGGDSDSQEGANGKLTISDYPADSKELEVSDVLNNEFETEEAKDKKPAPWKYPIKDNRVVIRMVRKYVPIGTPTKAAIIDLIKKAGLDRDTILKPVITDEEAKKKVTLTVKNTSGRNFDLWMFDCASCYVPPKPEAPGSPFSDLRMRFDEKGLNNTRTFKFSDLFDSDSGYFALFVRYTSSGGRQGQQYIGIHNLFQPPDRELVVGSNASPDEPFTATFTK